MLLVVGVGEANGMSLEKTCARPSQAMAAMQIRVVRLLPGTICMRLWMMFGRAHAHRLWAIQGFNQHSPCD